MQIFQNANLFERFFNQRHFWKGTSSAVLLVVATFYFFAITHGEYPHWQWVEGGRALLEISLKGWPFNLAWFQEYIFYDESDGERWTKYWIPLLNDLLAALAVLGLRACWWKWVLRENDGPPRTEAPFTFRLSTLLTTYVFASLMFFAFKNEGTAFCAALTFSEWGELRYPLNAGVVFLVFVAAESLGRKAATAPIRAPAS